MSITPVYERKIETGYQEMAQDETRETEALKWEEAALRDMDDECMK